MKSFNKHLVILSFLALAGCGFRPIYGSFEDRQQVAGALNNVAIANIADREGQMLRNHLIDRMYHNGRPQNPSATLEIRLSSSEISMGIQKDATTARQEYNLSANYVLKDNNGKELTKGIARSIVSYNKLDAQYGTLASKQNASDRAVKEVGEQIINRISLYFAEKASLQSEDEPQQINNAKTK